MSRFVPTVEFYSRYREPYSPKFFHTIAERLGLNGQQALLDVACGPGLLAIGLAPFVASVTALDPEIAMLDAAKKAAAEAGVTLSTVHGRIEQFSTAHLFDIVTLGRAIHWLDRNATLPVLERIVANAGRILICGAANVDSSESPWVKPYDAARRAWAEDPEQNCYRIDVKQWFAGSPFVEVDTISSTDEYQVTVDHLIGRALSKSNTSLAVIGERRPAFEAELRAALAPFAHQEMLREQIISHATVFARVSS